MGLSFRVLTTFACLALAVSAQAESLKEKPTAEHSDLEHWVPFVGYKAYRGLVHAKKFVVGGDEQSKAALPAVPPPPAAPPPPAPPSVFGSWAVNAGADAACPKSLAVLKATDDSVVTVAVSGAPENPILFPVNNGAFGGADLGVCTTEVAPDGSSLHRNCADTHHEFTFKSPASGSLTFDRTDGDIKTTCAYATRAGAPDLPRLRPEPPRGALADGQTFKFVVATETQVGQNHTSVATVQLSDLKKGQESFDFASSQAPKVQSISRRKVPECVSLQVALPGGGLSPANDCDVSFDRFVEGQKFMDTVSVVVSPTQASAGLPDGPLTVTFNADDTFDYSFPGQLAVVLAARLTDKNQFEVASDDLSAQALKMPTLISNVQLKKGNRGTLVFNMAADSVDDFTYTLSMKKQGQNDFLFNGDFQSSDLTVLSTQNGLMTVSFPLADKAGAQVEGKVYDTAIKIALKRGKISQHGIEAAFGSGVFPGGSKSTTFFSETNIKAQ